MPQMQKKKLLLAPLVLFCFFLLSKTAHAELYVISTPGNTSNSCSLDSGNHADQCIQLRGSLYSPVHKWAYSYQSHTWIAEAGNTNHGSEGALWWSTGNGYGDGTYVSVFCNDDSGTHPDVNNIPQGTCTDVIYYTQSGGIINATSSSLFFPSPHFTFFSLSTSTNTMNIQGFWEASSTPSASQQLVFWQESSIFGRESQFSSVATTSGFFNFTVPILPTASQSTASSTYTLIDRTTFRAYLFQLSETSTQTLTLDATTTSYLAPTSTNALAIGNPRDISNIPEAACGVTAIGGCIKNAFVWLFYPSSDSIAQFTDINYSGKFPFVYIYQIGAIRNSLLTASSTAPTGLSVDLWRIPGHSTTSVTLLSQSMVAAVPFSGTIYTIMGFLIWLGMAEYIYYRVIRMHDTNTPQ